MIYALLALLQRKAQHVFNAEVVEWQTRRSQKPVGLHPCGFDSHLRHLSFRHDLLNSRKNYVERCEQNLN